MSGLGVKVEGIDPTLVALASLGKGVAKRQAIKAVSAGAAVIKPEVVKRSPIDTGTLEQSFVVKARTKKRGEGAYALVGANRNIMRVFIRKGGTRKQVATFKRTRKGETRATGEKRLAKATAAGSKPIKRKPSRYLHLANNGTKRVKPTRFMDQAVQAKSNEAIARYRERLRKGLDEEVAAAQAKRR